jgi:hypothetical protein
MYKILGSDQKEYGPINAEMVKRWIAERRVNDQTLIQAEGSTDWKPLSQWLEFSEALAAGGPPPMPPSGPSALGPGPAAPVKTSGLAIASLALGAVGFCGVTALAGVILGIIALVRIRNSRGQLGGQGLAIAGVCLSGFMLLFAIPLLVGISLPAVAKAKGSAQTVACVNHLRQLSLAVLLYSKETLPSATNWCDALQSELVPPKYFQCPADRIRTACSYGYNAKLSGMKRADVAPDTVMLFEISGGWNVSGGPDEMITRHYRTYVVGLVDGSVRQVPAGQLDQLRWDPESP